MRLESVTLNNVGRFSGEAGVGPFDAGLNVLSAANEAGKTTLLMATARALFDRHNVTGEEITALQSVGTSLAPEVTVTFETAQGRFQITKRFLQSASAELREFRAGGWQAIADGDAADRRLLELVAGTRPGRGPSKPEHWGMLRHLWARQSELTNWPDFQNDTGERVRNRLAGIEIDRQVENLIAAFAALADAHYTTTGRLKKGGPLALLQETIVSEETALSELRATMQRMEQQQSVLLATREALEVCGTSRADAVKAAEALTVQRREVVLLQKDLERFSEATASAEQDLAAIDKDLRAIELAREALASAETHQKSLAAEAAARHEKDATLRAALAELKKQLSCQQDAIDELRKREARLRDIATLARQSRDATVLSKQFERASTLDLQLAALRDQRAALPDIDARKLGKLLSIDQEVRDLGIRAEAVGLRVRITPNATAIVTLSTDDQAATERSIEAGATGEVNATRAMAVTIPGWGHLDIVSGAQEAATLEAGISEQRTKLSELLTELKVESVGQAIEASEQGAAIDRELKTATDAVGALLEDWESLSDLKQALDRVKGSAAQLRAHLGLSGQEQDLTSADVEAQLSAVQDELRALGRSVTTSTKAVETHEKRLESVGVDRATCAAQTDEVGKQIAGLNARVRAVLDRYPDGIEKAMDRAQMAFVTAKAEKAVAASKLPDDWQKIEQRHERALNAASQVADEYSVLSQKISGIKAVLKEWGSQGSYSKETQLIESLSANEQAAEAMRSKATAARLLVALLEYRKKASVRTVLAPLEDQLSAAFAELTGDHTRRVFLDEDLQVSGIGRTRDACITFGQLSQGAKEQLILALRAAVALELSKEEPQILILDDVLVNTDPVRQQRVLDYLQEIAGKVQVLVLTCHPDMYRGVGTNVTIL